MKYSSSVVPGSRRLPKVIHLGVDDKLFWTHNPGLRSMTENATSQHTTRGCGVLAWKTKQRRFFSRWWLNPKIRATRARWGRTVEETMKARFVSEYGDA